MLAGVLLHVIELLRPVDGAAHTGAGVDRAIGQMDDVLLLVDDIDDTSIAERARVERLAARRWIEGGVIQTQREEVLPALATGDGGVERGAIRLGVVEASGHG